jgi:hypothetical protein
LACGGEGAKARSHCQKQAGCGQAFAAQTPADQGEHHPTDQGVSLHDAHGAWSQPDHMLQIQAKHQHADA